MNIEYPAVFLLLFQFALMGFSAYTLAGGFGKPSPKTIGIQIACIACNLFFAALIFSTIKP